MHFVIRYILVQLSQEGAGLFYGKHFLFGNGPQRSIAFLGADFGCTYGIFGDPLIADGFIEQRAQDTAVAFDRFSGIRLFDDDRFKVFVIGKPAAVAEHFRRLLFDVRSLFIKVIRGAAVDDILPRQLPEIHLLVLCDFEISHVLLLDTVLRKGDMANIIVVEDEEHLNHILIFIKTPSPKDRICPW